MNAGQNEQEKEWLQQLRQGKEDALRHIFDSHYRILLAEAYRIVPDKDLCQDLVQDVFVELWRKRADIDIHTSLRAYLRRSVVNRALNHLKTNKKYLFGQEDSVLERLDPILPDAQEQHQERDNLDAALHAAIRQLPEKCRLVFTLSRFEDLSHKEIAEKLGISTKTIENQITKAIKSLRETLTGSPNLSAFVIFAFAWLFGHRG